MCDHLQSRRLQVVSVFHFLEEVSNEGGTHNYNIVVEACLNKFHRLKDEHREYTIKTTIGQHLLSNT